MKIGQGLFQPVALKPLKQVKTVQTVEEEVNIVQQVNDSKQAIKEMAQQHVAEMQAARTDMGEDDPKAQRLIEKFKNGKKLTSDEMAYIRKNAPGMVDYIDRIMREREIIELGMKMAPSKTEVQMVVIRAAKQIEKHPNPEEREIRAKHLADAKHEYEQTEEYKEKPNSILDRENKRKPIRTKKEPKQSIQIAQASYEKTDKLKSQVKMEFEI